MQLNKSMSVLYGFIVSAYFNVVQMYRLACLRLTERCADMLISIRYEVHEAGDIVTEELAEPIARLEK